jgi:hypothetical protein
MLFGRGRITSYDDDNDMLTMDDDLPPVSSWSCASSVLQNSSQQAKTSSSIKITGLWNIQGSLDSTETVTYKLEEAPWLVLILRPCAWSYTHHERDQSMVDEMRKRR